MKNNTNITFKHSGHAGDIIYALPAIKQICLNMNAKAELYVFIDKVWHNFDDKDRPYKGLITDEIFAMLRPLLETLPFMSLVARWSGQRIAVDLDRVKYMGTQIGLPHSHISRWYGYAFPELQTDRLHERVFQLDDMEAHAYHESGDKKDYSIFNDAIVVNRTIRNLNPYVNYLFLQQYNVYFVGLLSEYELFREQVPTAKYIEVEDFLQLGIIIGNSKLFLGNQSMCFAIAEQLKINRALECYASATNVIPIGEGGFDYYTQEGLEYIVSKIMTT